MVFPKYPEYAKIPNTMKVSKIPANTEYILEFENVENKLPESTVFVKIVGGVVKKSRSNRPLRSKKSTPAPAKNGMLI